MVLVANKFRPPKKKIDLILSPAQISGEEQLPYFIESTIGEVKEVPTGEHKIISPALAPKSAPTVYQNPEYKIGAFKSKLAPVVNYSLGGVKSNIPKAEESTFQVNEFSATLEHISINDAWKLLAEKMKEMGRISLANSMRKPLEVLEGNNFEFRFDNSSQLEDATPEKQDIIDFLKQKTGIQDLSLTFTVTQNDTIELKKLSPKEKYQKMVVINPLLKILKEKLDLDLEY